MQSGLKCAFELGLKIKIISLFSLFLLLFMALWGPEDQRRDCWVVVLVLGHHTLEEGVHPRRGDEEAKGF